jgi:hypothetical protein
MTKPQHGKLDASHRLVRRRVITGVLRTQLFRYTSVDTGVMLESRSHKFYLRSFLLLLYY